MLLASEAIARRNVAAIEPDRFRPDAATTAHGPSGFATSKQV
jgi:hypothetical protein